MSCASRYGRSAPRSSKAAASRSRLAIRKRHGVLRFLDPDALAGFLHEAGLAVEQQFGDWDMGPLTNASEEIITIARRL